ncbi:hypothetical protein NPIL_269661, partial [Nephila pilipes]
ESVRHDRKCNVQTPRAKMPLYPGNSSTQRRRG